jgi:hypothetical protein
MATTTDKLAAVSRSYLGSGSRKSATKVLRMQDAAWRPIFDFGEYPHAFVHEVYVTFLFGDLNSRLSAADVPRYNAQDICVSQILALLSDQVDMRRGHQQTRGLRLRSSTSALLNRGKKVFERVILRL